MEINLYKQEALKTMAPLGDLIHNSVHMTLGMNTECTELLQALKNTTVDLVNVKEEIGDLMWYVANYATLHTLPLCNSISAMDIEFFMKKYYTPKETLEVIIITIGELQDLDKKLLAYKKPYDLTKQFGLFVHLNKLILAFCSKVELEFSKILQTNIDKLRLRYPNNFSEESAINRNLVQEREILEKNEI